MSRTWRLGTRGSALARAQSGHVADALATLTGDPVELVIIRTTGDAITDRPLGSIGSKGLFTKELEVALLDGAIDLAVHSYKDLPTENPEGLVVEGIPPRQDPRDVLVGARLDDLPAGAVVGTGSPRRAAQLSALRPDLHIEGIRGNVDTRLAKVQSGAYDAIILAAAGLNRLRLTPQDAHPFDAEAMIPAVGQGALAVQCRDGDAELRAHLQALSCPTSTACVAAERAFLLALGGGCQVPAACHATLDGRTLTLRAFLQTDAGPRRERVEVDVADGPAAGASLGSRMRADA